MKHNHIVIFLKALLLTGVCLMISLTLVSQQKKISMISPHYSFTIPVELNNLHPDIVEGKINIRVFNHDKSITIASKEKIFPIINGSYIKTLNLYLYAKSGINPQLAKHWKVILFLRIKGKNSFKHAPYVFGGPNAYKKDPGKPYICYDDGTI